MKKIFAIIFIVIELQGFSQALPYLNASLGNKNECVVDKDTNIYLFHFNQLEKYNKHLQPIWVKRYDSLTVSNLLLSKTNALFFIANQNCVGKMDTAGNIVWCKKTNLTFINMMLDHSNNLMLSHTSGLFKMDTLGNILYCKKFIYYSGNPTLLRDSMGVYDLIISKLEGISNMNLYKFRYSETLDSIISIKTRSIYNSCVELYNVFNSSLFPNTHYVYYRTSSCSSFGLTSGFLEKYKGDSIIYSIPYNVSSGPSNLFNNITEDNKGNMYFSQSRRVDESGPIYSGGYHNDIYKIDSVGNYVTTSRLMNDIWTNSPPVYIGLEKGTFHFLYNNHFVLDYIGRGYGLNNPAIKSIDSTISTSCSSATTYTFIKGQGVFSTITSPVISKSSDVSYSITTQTVNITVVSNFVPDTNYC
ncbi:MAG: hypothetical protein H7101_08315, partial [Deinococcales bacterium]|nr:hypothetical protein [Chitinophagaceae bacterium]